MAEIRSIFQRYEKKYILAQSQYTKLYEMIKDRFVGDEYGKSTIMNIYFDTAQSLLIQRSLDKPVYKEKLRLRSYGVPDDNTNAFIEIKKKYKGVVYKRRVKMKYIEAYNYLVNGEKAPKDTQILREIDWLMQYYKGIVPAMVISYDREAMFSKEDKELRITFDSNLRFRTDELDLRKGAFGENILDENQYLMEIKIPGSMPVWLAKALGELEIYPVSFSKYGTAYRKEIGYFDKLNQAVFADCQSENDCKSLQESE